MGNCLWARIQRSGVDKPELRPSQACANLSRTEVLAAGCSRDLGARVQTGGGHENGYRGGAHCLGGFPCPTNRCGAHLAISCRSVESSMWTVFASSTRQVLGIRARRNYTAFVCLRLGWPADSESGIPERRRMIRNALDAQALGLGRGAHPCVGCGCCYHMVAMGWPLGASLERNHCDNAFAPRFGAWWCHARHCDGDPGRTRLGRGHRELCKRRWEELVQPRLNEVTRDDAPRLVALEFGMLCFCCASFVMHARDTEPRQFGCFVSSTSMILPSHA